MSQLRGRSGNESERRPSGHGVWSDGKRYVCDCCGHTWAPRKRYHWWPISFGWHRGGALKFFDWHGWQTGWDGIEQRVFGHTVHVGALKIKFGPVSR